MGHNVARMRPANVAANPAKGMSRWRTQLAVGILAVSLSPAGAQSLGDVARSERARRARMAQHAPMLTDEDLHHDRILKRAPGVSDSALPSPENTTPTAVDENLPLGDYARALRRRRLAEPAPPENAVATGPAPATLPAPVAIVAHEPQPAVAPAAAEPKPASLGDLAREVRAEREAARRIRLQEQKRAAQEKLAQQKPVQPAVQASKNKDAVQTAKVAQPLKPPPQAAHVAATATKSAKPAQLTEVAAKPSAPQVAKAAPQTVVKVAPQTAVKVVPQTAAKPVPQTAATAAPQIAAGATPQIVAKAAPQTAVKLAPQTAAKAAPQTAAKPAVQVSKNLVHVEKAAPAVKAAPLAAQAAPIVTRVKPAQLTTVATKPVPQPAPQAKAEEPASTADGQTVRVPRGASLWTLARTYLGAGSLWAALWKANPQIKDPNRIRAGQVLRLPDLDDDDNPGSNGF